MEGKVITNVIVSVDGRKCFRLIADKATGTHYNDLADKAREADVEPIIVTDNGIESEPWWSDDSCFVFDNVASRMTDGPMEDWPEGLFEFTHRIVDTDDYKSVQTFSVNGHTCVCEPSYEDLSVHGKVCEQKW